MVANIVPISEAVRYAVTDYTNNGQCIGCGKCCSNLLPLSSGEIKDIKRYLKKHPIQEQKHFSPTKCPSLDMTCPFMKEDREKDKCSIYPVRPQICRLFKCDQSTRKIETNKALLWRERNAVNMRKTFFRERSEPHE